MLAAANLWAQSFPPGFSDELVVENLDVPITFAFAPDGRIFIAEQGGAIRVFQNGQLLPDPMIVIPTMPVLEQGLLGLALEPSFPDPPYLYVNYTVQSSHSYFNTNRVSRFTVDANTIHPESEVVLYDQIETGVGYHVAGCLRFDLTGNLLVSTGDNGLVPPLPQDPGRVQGKILRIRPDGTIPPDNPFVGVPGALPEVYQLGLRNPFRFAIQPGTGLVFIADVGQDSWEEVDVGPPGANFGWPVHEGPVAPPDSAYVNPLYAYDHSQGEAIVGNVFYQGTQFPAEFDGNYFFFDHVSGRLGRLVLGPGNSVVSAENAWIALSTSGWLAGPVDLVLGPDGALYYNTYVPGQIRRIVYTGNANRNPAAVATASPAAGYPPLDVVFHGSGSYDADRDSLSYDWNFGDGTAHSNEQSPVHTYGTNGHYSARLTVSDGRGGQATSQPLPITVGNLPPDVTIAEPVDGSFFTDGQTVAFSGSAADPETGPMPSSALHWNVYLNHETHLHPVVLDQVGAGGSFVASLHGEDPTQIAFRITAWAVDAAGLRGERTVFARPLLSQAGPIVRTYAVPANDRDATSIGGVVRTSGSAPGDPSDYVSSDAQQASAAVEFQLDLPHGVTIQSAYLIVRAGSTQEASAIGGMTVRAYDTGDAAPFANGPYGSLETHQPTLADSVAWVEPLSWRPGEDYTSPEITALLQAIVDRPDWVPGNHFGVVVTRGTIKEDRLYGWSDYAAGGPGTRLHVTFASPTAVEPPPRVPAGLDLAQNVPNPFNPSTRIAFRLGSAGRARLRIFDPAGRLVRTLVDALLTAGAHTATWDGRDDRGVTAASGVYWYRLDSTGRTRSRRMVVAR